MAITTLAEKLAAAEQSLEEAKALVYRYAGAIQLLKQLIAEADTPVPDKDT